MSIENGNFSLVESDNLWLTKILMDLKRLEAARDNFVAYLYQKHGLDQNRYMLDIRTMSFKPWEEK